MAEEIISSDIAILDLLRKHETVTVTELANVIGVTATAVRQRLTRLLAQGYIERKVMREGRGRPSHDYTLTTKGRRKTGANFADLAVALWQEVREIKDPEVRKGLLQRISKRMASLYEERLSGNSIAEKMESLAELFGERQIPFEVNLSNPLLPVLTALACPYPELAEQDRSICSMEKMLFTELLGENVKLSDCRLDGATCCNFTTESKSFGEPKNLSSSPHGDCQNSP
jgi:DeoR family transcriptional regulator, suf operon transcriptional repressor